MHEDRQLVGFSHFIDGHKLGSVYRLAATFENIMMPLTSSSLLALSSSFSAASTFWYGKAALRKPPLVLAAHLRQPVINSPGPLCAFRRWQVLYTRCSKRDDLHVYPVLIDVSYSWLRVKVARLAHVPSGMPL